MRGFTSGLLILGISFIYGFSGSTNFNFILTYLSVDPLMNVFSINYIFFYVGGLLVLIGIFFKLGVFPFHF